MLEFYPYPDFCADCWCGGQRPTSQLLHSEAAEQHFLQSILTRQTNNLLSSCVSTHRCWVTCPSLVLYFETLQNDLKDKIIDMSGYIKLEWEHTVTTVSVKSKATPCMVDSDHWGPCQVSAHWLSVNADSAIISVSANHHLTSCLVFTAVSGLTTACLPLLSPQVHWLHTLMFPSGVVEGDPES